uniref:Immunoglobulin heavy constant epsilon n=1 Tax=Oryctolagus cuniculus TaxID=9986 RepID=G1SK63_RABIT
MALAVFSRAEFHWPELDRGWLKGAGLTGAAGSTEVDPALVPFLDWLSRAGLSWTVLDWADLGSAELGCTALGWAEQDWAGLTLIEWVPMSPFVSTALSQTGWGHVGCGRGPLSQWGPGSDTGPVPSVSIQAPSVFPLASCCRGATARAASVTLGCLVKGYFPEPVSVTWDAGTLNSSTVTLPAVTLDTGLSTTVSQVTISGAWAKQRFTCSVAHTPSGVGSDRAPCSVSFTPPAVRLFHSSCDPRENDTYTVQLLCLISGYTPGDIEVTWLVDGQKDPNMFSITAQPRQEGKLASTHSELNITQGEWASKRTYTCRVAYQGELFEAHARECTDYEPRGVSTYLSSPSPLDLYVHKSPKLTCLVVDLASEEGVSLVWSRDSGKPVDPDPWKSDKQFNATVIIRSTLPVDAQDWIDGEIFKCTVTHPDLPTAIVRSISKAQGKRAAPEVHLFTPPEEDQGSRDQLTLTCLVQNFFPADIFVDWLRNGQHMPSGQQSTTEPRLAGGSNQTYFVFSRLEVSRADWEQNIPFTCRVVHEAVTDTRTLLKTVSKRPGK